MGDQAGHQAYGLRCELIGHQEDVRGLCACDVGLVTSSRDKTAKIWVEDEGGKSFSVLQTLFGHSDYVGPIAFMPPKLLPEHPNGAIITGSRDTTVRVWDPTTAAEVRKLVGHRYQVTCVGVLPNGDIVSGSLDKTVKVWRNLKCIQTLGEEFDSPVLSLLVTPSGDIMSGSSDGVVRRWCRGQCVQTYKGHTDTVRSLALLPHVGFVSGSHDFSLRVWAMSGETLAELHGHTALVYSVAATETGLVASGSEDNTVRIWRASGECLQTIEHPGNIWAVEFLPNQDVVTACSDAVARIWSAAPERQGDAETVAGYASLLEMRKAEAQKSAQESAGGGGGGASDGLPPGLKAEPVYALSNPGAKDGETKIIREDDGSVCAYAWNAASNTWDKIGEVVPAPEPGAVSNAPKYHLGRTWDYVVDVDMGEGVPAKKLAFDREENPYIVADRFLEEEGLPVEFKEQIVQFIIQNTEQGAGPRFDASAPITGGFCDPFSGGGSNEPMPPPRQHAAAPGPSAYDVTGGGVDPFTGGASSRSAAPSASSSQQQVPARTYLLFDNAPPAEGLGKRLREFNASLAGDAEYMDATLTEAEAAPGGALDALLASLPAAASGSGTTSQDLLSLTERLLKWPGDKLFPALDIARCLVLQPTSAAHFAATAGTFSEPRIGGLACAIAVAALASGNAAAQQTALRLATNCFKEPSLRAWLLANRGPLLDGFADCYASGTKGVRMSAATLLLNLAVASRDQGSGLSGDAEGKMQILSQLEELLRALPGDETEGGHRAVVALGTLVAGDGEASALCRELGIGALAKDKFGAAGGKVAAAVEEVQRLL